MVCTVLFLDQMVLQAERGQLGLFSCPAEQSCMISHLGKTDTKPPDSVLELQCVVSFGSYEVHSSSSPKPNSVPCPLVKIHWGLFFLFSLHISPASYKNPTIPESRLSKGLKSSQSEISPLCFILPAPPPTIHVCSYFNLRGGGEQPVTGHQGLYVGSGAFWFMKSFLSSFLQAL